MKKGRMDPRKLAALKSDQKKIFKKAVVTFFSEDSEDILSLTNQMLFDALCSVHDEPNDSDLDHLRQAREDPTVWSEGLDPEYSRFIGQASPLACLLSILWRQNAKGIFGHPEFADFVRQGSRFVFSPFWFWKRWAKFNVYI